MLMDKQTAHQDVIFFAPKLKNVLEISYIKMIIHYLTLNCSILVVHKKIIYE